MSRRGEEMDDDEDDSSGPSEATIVLTAKMSADFRRAFPLRSESIVRKPTPLGTSTLSQISKRLDFEDSFNSRSELNSNVMSVKSSDELGTLKRDLLIARNDIQRLESLKNEKEKRIKVLQMELVKLKKEFIKQKNSVELDKVKNEFEQILLSRNEWCDAAICFYRSFQCLKARLIVAEREICSRGLMDSALKHALASAWTSMEYNVEDIKGNLHEVIKGVISTLEDLDKNIQAETEFSGEELSEVGPKKEVQCHGSSSEVSDDRAATITGAKCCSQNLHHEALSPIFSGIQNEGRLSFFSNTSDSILNSTLANTSIDYEKDERIQRLESENSRLKDEKCVLLDRARKYLLVEEQWHTAEHKCNVLEKSLEEILVENNSLRSACARKLFDIADCSSHDRAAEVTKRIQSLADSVEVSEKQREDARSEAERLKKVCELLATERDVLSKRVDDLTSMNEALKRNLNEEKEECATLKRTVDLRDIDLESIQKEVVALRSRVNYLESKGQNSSSIPTDAGDETQILHLRFNPMQCAVHDLQEAEKGIMRKRKAEAQLSNDEPCDVKRAREEQITALENQLKKSEREKEQTIRLQSDLAKRYREISTALTGYQIKLKDVEEGICCVNSVYDDTEKQFVFKYNGLTGIVDLLDIGDGLSQEQRPWEKEMQKYIGERHSIPGFLAAVTLQLEARRGDNEVERTQTLTTQE